jgi:serine/threonine protein kinase/tetratricopeptide (TPR) repeat protein
VASLSGQTVSHYKILEHLGGGGMGVVYKAEDAKLKRIVALKFLPPDLTRDPEAKERFIHEAQAASALQHNNICVVYDIDETPDGQMFISMEYLDGETLKKKIERGALKIEEAIDIAIQVGQGLSKAHEHSIIHRDIKPANIMVTADGAAKIVDFGLAKLTGRTMLTKSGSTLGTAAYMSPEQARGESANHRTDIWSLGVVLYEMLSGKRPFEAEYENALLYSILNSEPEPITSHRTGVPRELERIVTKTLEKNQACRYQHVDELTVDLFAVRNAGATPTISVSGRPSRAQPKRRLRKLALTGGAILALGLLIGGVWLLRERLAGGSAEDRHESLAVLPLSAVTKTEDEQMFVDGIHDEIISHISKIHNLRVIARTSVMQYRGTTKTIPQIASELNVDAVLEGSIQRAGNTVRVIVQLIDGGKDEHLWSQTYDRPYADIFEIQTDLAKNIAAAMEVVLSPTTTQILNIPPTTNVDAYDYYLRGRYYWQHFSHGDSLAKSVELFERATTLDTTFAAALAGSVLPASDLLDGAKISSDGHDYGPDTTRARLLSIESNLARAVGLAPKLKEVLFAEGYYRLAKGDREGAITKYELALQENPNDPNLLGELGKIYCFDGRCEKGLPYLIRSVEGDPFGPEGFINTVPPHKYLIYALIRLRRWDDADRWCTSLAARIPSWAGFPLSQVRIAMYGLGDLQLARQRYSEFHRRFPNSPDEDITIELLARNFRVARQLVDRQEGNFLTRALACRLVGDVERAKGLCDSAITGGIETLHRMLNNPQRAPLYMNIALAQAAQGQKARALRLAEQAFAEYTRACDRTPNNLDWLRSQRVKVLILIGEDEKALCALDSLISKSDGMPDWSGEMSKWGLTLDPMYDPVRNDPRFRSIVDRAR